MNTTKALRLFKVPLKKDLPPVPIPEKEVDKFAEKKFRKINEKKVFYTNKKDKKKTEKKEEKKGEDCGCKH
tara:strand:- start:429 stop:641 length:213 start_codon:yes stop_codon:yes gene_type:complete